MLRWLNEAAFQDAYRTARREVIRQAITQVQRATGEAVETLRTVMQDQGAPASARVSAARTVLDVAVKAVELEDLEGPARGARAGAGGGRAVGWDPPTRAGALP